MAMILFVFNWMLVKSNYCLHGLLKVKAITSLLIIIIMEAESKKSLLSDDDIKFSGDKLETLLIY